MIGVVGDYELLKVEAEGAMGVVYRARHRLTQRVLAVKAIHAGLVHQREARQRFLREATIASELRHSGIVHTYLPFDVEGGLYLPMELLVGQSLAQHLAQARRRRLEANRAVEIAREAAAALGYAHGRRPPVIHRDVKPANLFLVEGGRVKLLDFGLARSLGEGRQTQTGLAVGTPLYMAPELLRGEGEIGPAVDVYALGMVLFEMLAGRPPVDVPTGANVLSTIRAIDRAHEQGLPRVRELAPQVEPWLDALVAQCLSTEPSQRPRTGDELVRAFDQPAVEPLTALRVPLLSDSLDPSAEPLDRGIAPRARPLDPLSTSTDPADPRSKSFLPPPSRLATIAALSAAGIVALTVASGANNEGFHLAEHVRNAEAIGEPGEDPGAARGVPGGMVEIPEGEFFMGCNQEVDTQCDSDEKPGKRVNLPTFYIDRTEVTVDAYAECVRAGRCSRPGRGDGCNWGRFGRGNHPINCIDWSQANTYCLWKDKRLPTEAEWEKAARGTDGRKYPWGNQAASCRFAVMDDGGPGCGRNSTWPVDSKPEGASPYGALHMAGNVWEWTSSWYSQNETRVLRGGGWDVEARVARVSFRIWGVPSGQVDVLGARCAQSF